jgi:hypothetical protein
MKGKTSETDARGIFHFSSISINKQGELVHANKPGYFTTSRNLFYTADAVNFMHIGMLPRKLSGTISSVTGGSVSINGASISVPANGVVKNGTSQNYVGTIKIFAAFISPENTNAQLQKPGNIFTIPKDNNINGLADYGTLAVELETENGELLQLAPNAEAILKFPAASGLSENMFLYRFNDTTGFWKKENTVTKSGNELVAKVNHFSFWSVASPFPVVDFEARLLDLNNEPIANELVVITRTGSNLALTGYGITDSMGVIRGKLPANETLNMIVGGICAQTAFSTTIGPFTTTANLGTVQVIFPGSNLVQVTGRLVDCQIINSPISQGYVTLRVDNREYKTMINNEGLFNLKLYNCNNASIGALIGFDQSTQKSTTMILVSLNSSNIQLGDIATCLTSTADLFFTYSIDNTYFYNYYLSGYVKGSFYYTSPAKGMGIINGGNDLAWYPEGGVLRYEGDPEIGSFPVYDFNHEFNRNHSNFVSKDSGTYVSISEFGEIGQFISGTVNDTMYEMVDQVKIPRLIKIAFRVKRTQ